MLSSFKGEAKTQAVADLARDPDSNVTAEDVENTIVSESRKAGAPAFRFDANATPEEKARQAARVGTTEIYRLNHADHSRAPLRSTPTATRALAWPPISTLARTSMIYLQSQV